MLRARPGTWAGAKFVFRFHIQGHGIAVVSLARGAQLDEANRNMKESRRKALFMLTFTEFLEALCRSVGLRFRGRARVLPPDVLRTWSYAPPGRPHHNAGACNTGLQTTTEPRSTRT
jgi:hypothetical protein